MSAMSTNQGGLNNGCHAYKVLIIKQHFCGQVRSESSDKSKNNSKKKHPKLQNEEKTAIIVV